MVKAARPPMPIDELVPRLDDGDIIIDCATPTSPHQAT
jgi:predicted amidohydrolase